MHYTMFKWSTLLVSRLPVQYAFACSTFFYPVSAVQETKVLADFAIYL